MSAADEALGRNSEDDLAHYLKARALWGLDRKDEALEELQRAADVSRAADSLTPYYYFYKGQYLQELGRADDALQAYHTSFDNWRQDMNLGYDLLAKFNEVGDQEYKDKVKAEIDIMAQQDAVVLTFGLHRGDTPGGVIMTGEGQSESSSQEYEPGYAGKD
jgi:tetratricopeptide (TPR) repeat protein